MHLAQALISFEMAARLKLFNAYDWHRLVWQAFPGRPEASREFLTRLERQEREGRFRLLMLSASAPERPASLADSGTAWQVKEVSGSFLEHPAYRFQLRANPVKRDNKTRKRVPLLTREEQAGWLNRKANHAGFRVIEDSLRIIPEGRQRFRDRTHGKAGLHHAVEYAGSLVVEDRDAFRRAFASGIGSAKAFGFGLLALIPCVTQVETT